MKRSELRRMYLEPKTIRLATGGLRHVERIFIGDLIYSPATVFYSVNPDDYPGTLPEYINTTERGNWELVWIVYYGEKNPYLKPTPEPMPIIRGLSGLINSLPSDYF